LPKSSVLGMKFGVADEFISLRCQSIAPSTGPGN
jgi:hypothetical protein